ncbi:HRDC domain-containing protein [Treponema succinifaciens]|uniref:HRDC domain-containing protein n=1 Tax=Treponema succinifaciens TaxID=167 RepID=UPI002357D188|nr:HRDC domain-containing protein [Treponema succinifaciens]
MALLTQFMTFFVSPFSEPSSHAELNNFLKSRRIINVEKRLIDGERGTGWIFLVEYSDNDGSKQSYTMSSKIDWRDVLNPSQFAVYDLLRKKRKEIGERTKIPLYGILSNEQLALMAQNPPKTKEEFIKIKGVGEQKYKQFGEEFLETIKSAMLSAEQAENVAAAAGQVDSVPKKQAADSAKADSAENKNQLDIF